MQMDWSHFTPWSSLAGGVLTGLSASAMVVLLGRVTGISGIVGRLLQAPTWRDQSQWAWRLAFVAGLVAAPLLWRWFAPLPPMQMPTSVPWVVVAGLLVGFGTRLGSGCTSGHGVCGISRLSGRSMVATVIFMAAGAATVFIVRHVLGLAA